MSLSQIGLVMDMIGVAVLAHDTWLRVRGIQANCITVGHGELGCLGLLPWVGYPLLFFGFMTQLIGSMR